MAVPGGCDQALVAALDEYDASFGWVGLCLACGHAPLETHHAIERLYLAHRSHPGNSRLFPLVGAHWDVVNAAEAVTAAATGPARAAHRCALRDFRRQLRPLQAC